MSNSGKAGKISADQKAEAESMQSLKTVALQRIAREIRQIYSDPRDINLYSEQKEWNVDEILCGGDVRPFFDSIAKLSTMSAARIMLVYLMRVNGIDVGTDVSEEAIRFVDYSDEKIITDYLDNAKVKTEKSGQFGPAPKDVLYAVSERTREVCRTQGFTFRDSGYRSWNRLFAALLKNPDLSLLTIPAFAYRMPRDVCELFMQKAMRRDYFNLYDREELLIWIVLVYSDSTDSYFDNYRRLCALYPEDSVKIMRPENGKQADALDENNKTADKPDENDKTADKPDENDKTADRSDANNKMAEKPDEIAEDTVNMSTVILDDAYCRIIEAMSDVSEVFLARNESLVRLMTWAAQRATDRNLPEKHRIRRTNEKKFREMVKKVVEGFSEYAEYTGLRRDEKRQKDVRKKSEQNKQYVRIQYEPKPDGDGIMIPAGTKMYSDLPFKGEVTVSENVVLREKNEIEVTVRAITKKDEVSEETLSKIKEFVPNGQYFNAIGSEYQGYIGRVRSKSSVRYLDTGKASNNGTLSVTCTAGTFIPAGMKFSLSFGKDTFQYEVLESGNLVEKKIPMKLVSVDILSGVAAPKKGGRTGKRNLKTRLLMNAYGDENKKKAEGVISADSGKDGSLPMTKIGAKGFMNAYCRCNTVVPAGTEFYLEYGNRKYIYETTEKVKVGVVQEAEIPVEWTNADELFEEAQEKSKEKHIGRSVTLIPDRTEFHFYEAQPTEIVRIYTPKAMRYGREVRNEDDIQVRSNYYSVFEKFCGDIADKDYKGISCYGADFLLNTQGFKESRIKSSNRYSFGTDSTRKRNQLLTLAFLENCMQRDDPDDDRGPVGAVARFRLKANKMLEDCGMYEIYEGNAIDVFFLLMAAADLPGELYADLWKKDHPLTEYLTVKLKKTGNRYCRILRYDKHENREVWVEWEAKIEPESRELFASVPRMLRSENYRYVLELAQIDGEKSLFDIKLNDLREYLFEEV